MDKPFTDEEQKIMDHLIDAYSGFIDLDRKGGHPTEVQEFVTAIHQLQAILEHRALKRLYPNYFK